MNFDRWINPLVTMTLVEMMFAVGLSVSSGEVLSAARQVRLALRLAIANYLLVPAAAAGLLLLFHAQPMAAAGFLILAVCPGAPYGPPLTAIAKGDAALSVGWMVMLACSSALIAPLALGVLLPWISGETQLEIDPIRLAKTLLATQFAPLCAGWAFRAWRPRLSKNLLPAATRLSKLLNLTTIGLILVTQAQVLLAIRLAALAGMLALLTLSLAAGWLLGGPSLVTRKTMALTTSLRNAGVGMVVASACFPGTLALTAVLAYAIVDVLGSLTVAIWWGRRR